MAFEEGLISDLAPGARLVERIEAVMGLVGNWSFVESFTTTTGDHRIWKCAGSGMGANSFGSDFYVGLSLPAGGVSPLWIRAFEGWNAVGKLPIRWVCGVTTSNGAGADSATNQSIVAYDAAAVGFGGTTLSDLEPVGYLISVSKDRLIAGTKWGISDTGFYAGLMEPLMPNDPFPLVIAGDGVNDNFNSSASVGSSRHPTVTTSNANNFQFTMQNWTQIAGDAATADRFWASRAVGSRVLVKSFGTSLSVYGLIRGLLRGIVWCATAQSGNRTGSTILIGAETYTRVVLAAPVWVRNLE